MASSKLSVIIPAYSGHAQLRQCMDSLCGSQYTDFGIVIVDHGSTDKISRWVNREYPQATCIRGSDKLWWSGATNLGIRHALENGNNRLMLLNHDCYVRPDTIGRLVADMEVTPDAVIAPLQHNKRTGKDVICATSLFLLGFSTIIPPAAWCRFRHKGNLIPTSLIIGGRGVLLPADVFYKVGYFDEKNLPHYGADHDFYFRCKKAGIGLFICRDATVEIDDNKTTAANLDKNMSPAEFRDTLSSRSSHRNIRDQYALFSRHYPIPGLAGLGVGLHLLRYSLIYLLKKVFGNKTTAPYK